MNIESSTAVVTANGDKSQTQGPMEKAPATPTSSASPSVRGPGTLLVLLGACGLMIAAILPLMHSPTNDGALPACALISILFGLAFIFPTLLQDGTASDPGAPNISTMRVAVLMIVSVFALVVVKAGWATPALVDLKIDSSWAWVLAAAFGGKAAQSFAEAPPK